MVWADKILGDHLDNLKLEEVNYVWAETSGSIQSKLLHIAEEYIGWLYDLRSQSWQNTIEKLKEMDHKEILHQMESCLVEWRNYIDTCEKKKFLIDEGEFKVPITLNEVVFNLVNHSSYHRGQIFMLLRSLGHEVRITDYYWYKIHQMNLN